MIRSEKCQPNSKAYTSKVSFGEGTCHAKKTPTSANVLNTGYHLESASQAVIDQYQMTNTNIQDRLSVIAVKRRRKTDVEKSDFTVAIDSSRRTQ